MKKSNLYVLGSVEAIIGSIIICITSIIKEAIPKLGYIAYQNAAAGSYDPMKYEMSFGTTNFIAISLVALGNLQIIFARRKSN